MAGTHSPQVGQSEEPWAVRLLSPFAHAGLSGGNISACRSLHPKGSTLELLREAASLISNYMDGLPPVTPQAPLHPALQ